MEIILEKELPHQQKAVDALRDIFIDVPINKATYYYMNPIIDIHDPQLKHNIYVVQKKSPSIIHKNQDIGEYLNLDIKMETGTGKTYVYTKTIFELHKKYGLNKFIIAVPSLAIKAGTKQFIEDKYVKKHFYDECNYRCEIELGVVESLKKKKGKFCFPSVIREFVKGSSQIENKIYVLLINMQLLTTGTMLTRDDYDYFPEGFSRPFDALRATKPIVIIDEPHRFSRTQKAFKVIENELHPQCIIRYGATFPKVVNGRGNNRTTINDYENLIYDLNARDAFNQNLIKGVTKEHFEPISGKDEKVKVSSINSKDSVVFHHIIKNRTTKSITLKKDESLSIISNAFEGLTIKAIGTNYIELSNGQTKYTGEEFVTDIYSTSYQEQMLKLALERHFEIEKANFCGRKNKIKTLALFFIDDIYSYREKKNGKEAFLKKKFEKLLLDRINIELAKLTDYEAEYREYLLASKADISACHAGYFSQDNDDTDEKIEKEVNDILRNKKNLLSIRNPDNSYNTRRFLFSKWTLKEGWDNPNIFTIAKLRSSGSEISKLQEVGRGLRLPVDEYGNRISNEEFTLNYIVDFTEADFAQKLINQINLEIPEINIKDMLEKVAKMKNEEPDILFAKLLMNHYIDRDYNIISENKDKFLEEYPEFISNRATNKITDRNKKKIKPIKIRPAVYNELKELWLAINQRYLLFFDETIDNDLQSIVNKIFLDDTFTDVYLSSIRQNIINKDGHMIVAEDSGVQYQINNPILYSEFLKQINKFTKININTIHNGIVNYINEKGKLDPQYINENSVKSFVQKFNEWKSRNLQGRFQYVKSNLQTQLTSLTYADGTPKKEIVQGRIGTKFVEGTPSHKYLYDVKAYDSPLELENIESGDIEEIVVYGKIPRNSIAIPTIAGGSYSPDFMYIVKKANGEKELNIIVETKDVQSVTNLRGTEEIKLQCAEQFFKQLELDGYKVAFHKQINNTKIKHIIDEVLREG